MMELFARSNGSPDQGPAIVGVSLGLLVFGLVLLSSRLAIRIKSVALGPDDILLTMGWLLSLGHSINDCIAVYRYGYGRHEADLSPAQAKAGLTSGAALGFYISQILYKLSIACTKLSICLLYRRIFAFKKTFHKAIWSVMALIILYYTSALLVTIFGCTPIDKSWHKKKPGHCISVTNFFYANASFNIFTDVLIMALPIPIIHALQLPVRQRIALVLIFMVGLFATATSVIRIFTLSSAGGSNGDDTTWEVASSTVWSSAEMNTTIICACLPMLRIPLQSLFPRLFSTMSSSSNSKSKAYALSQQSSRRFSKHHASKIHGVENRDNIKMHNVRGGTEKGTENFENDDDQEGILKKTEFTVVFDDDDRQSDRNGTQSTAPDSFGGNTIHGESMATLGTSGSNEHDHGMRTMGMAV